MEFMRVVIVKFGFVSVIFLDFDLDFVLWMIGELGYDCVELMCWLSGGVECCYVGVMYVIVEDFMDDDVKCVKELIEEY